LGAGGDSQMGVAGGRSPGHDLTGDSSTGERRGFFDASLGPGVVIPLLEREDATSAPAVNALIHDINNTLSTVVGFSELILDKPGLLNDRETTLRYLGAIKVAGREAAQMLIQLQTELWPANPANPIVPAAWPAPNLVTGGGVSRELTILLIDDDERVRSVIADCLTGDGHQVEVAAGGEAGLAMLMTHRSDIVITDRAMPGMDGHLVASAVKRLAPGTAVMMLTGFGEAMKAEAGPPADVDLLVSKPLTLSDLRQALVAVLR
jgi:two-component system cell cycle response regulator CpdR